MLIRPEKESEQLAVREINVTAFETDAESKLVDALRAQASPLVSLVAIKDETLAGHIMFSPVAIAGFTDLRLMGLAPMAVAPRFQRNGIGSALVEHGLEACRQLGSAAVVVLGHPEFYPRFGFKPASCFEIHSEYDVPDDVFMAREIVHNSLQDVKGTARYHAAFGEL